MAQDGFKMALKWLKIAPRGFKMAHVAMRQPHGGGMYFLSLNMSPQWPKMASRWSYNGSR